MVKKANSQGAIVGLIGGVAVNAILWIYFPNISWLWWNLTGFLFTFIVGILVSYTGTPKVFTETLTWEPGVIEKLGCKINWGHRSLWLVAYFILITIVCYGLSYI